MSTRKINTIKVNDVTPTDHLGRLGEITYRDGFLYYHDGVTPGGELISGSGGSGGPTTWSSVTGRPSFAAVATSGSYADLINKPSIPTDINDLTDTDGLLTDTGDFTFTGGTASLPAGSVMVLDTFQVGGNKQSTLTLSTATISSLDAGNNLRLRTGYGTGFEKDWILGADGNLTAPGNLQVDGGKIVLHPYGNAYVESVDYGVDSANSAVNIFGGPHQKIKLRAGFGTEATWTFGTDGNLTLPSGGTISEGGGLTGAIRLTPAGGANEYQALMIYPTAAGDGDHIHLTAGGGTTELYLGSDSHFVKLANDGAVVIQANDGVSSNQQWLFDTDGTLQLPAGGDIVDNTGTSVLGGGTTLPANASGYLVNDGDGALSWAAGDGTFSGAYADLTGKPTLFDGDYNNLTNKPTIRIAVVGATGGPVGANLQADSLALAGLNPVTDIPSTWGGDLILQGGVGGANSDLYGEVRIKSGTIGANYEWHFTTNKKIRLPAGGDIVDSNSESVLGGQGRYTPANAGDWAGTAPTTIAEALDRIAARLNGGGTGAP